MHFPRRRTSVPATNAPSSRSSNGSGPGRDTGDPTVRERIILAHLGLAERLATRYRRRGGAGYEDLVQTARVGLVAAVNRYDPDRGNSFIVYAIVCITGELRRYLRDTSWRVHVTRTLKERALRVVRARDELTVVLERSPTPGEIAARLSMTEEQVAEALEAIDTRCQWSLDAPVGADGTTSLGALLPAPAGEVELEDRLSLPELLADLPDVERRAVVLRFYGGFKQHEIGAMLGYSQIHVSRLLRRALNQLREQFFA